MATLSDEIVLLLVATVLPAKTLLCLAGACHLYNRLLASPALEDVWARLLLADFGPGASRRPESSAAADSARTNGHSGSRGAHCALSELRQTFDKAIAVIHGDLCGAPHLYNVDAIVCPSVPSCGPYGPCARAVHRIAGPKLLEYVQTEVLPPLGGHLDVGQAIVAPPFGFPGIRAIVHVVGPTIETPNRRERLRDAYCSALGVLGSCPGGPLCHAATASISTGGNGISPREAAPIAMAAIRDAVCKGSLKRLYIVAWDEYTQSLFEDAKRAVLECFSEDPVLSEIDPQDFLWD